MTGRLRLGVLSGVRHARPYLDLLQNDSRLDIVGIAESDDAPQWAHEDARAVAGDYGIDPRGLDELLASCDVALVCTEPVRHAAMAVRALEAGVHVIVDKPVATTLADAAAVRDAAERATGRCTVVNRTHAAPLRRARSWVDGGQIGMPLHVDAESLSSGAYFARAVERPELLFDPALSGGGELLNFLGYGVDAVRYLTGLEAVSVQAFGGTLFDMGHGAAGLEDVAVVSLGLEHGVTATLTVGRVPFAPSHAPALNSFRLLGSHGHATGDDAQPAVLRFGADATTALPFAGGRLSDPITAFFDHVLTALLAGEQPEYTAQDAWRAMEVIDAAYRSIASGDAVVLA